MSLFKKLLLINLGILAAYWIACKVDTYKGSEGGLGFAIEMMLCIALHVTILTVAGVGYALIGNEQQRNAYLASAGLTLLIGFSSCLGGASI